MKSVYTCGPRNLKTTMQVIELMFLRCSDSASQWTRHRRVSLVELHLIECKELLSCKLSLIPSSITCLLSSAGHAPVTPRAIRGEIDHLLRYRVEITICSILSSGQWRSWCLLLRTSRTPCTMFSLYMIQYSPLLVALYLYQNIIYSSNRTRRSFFGNKNQEI